MLETKSAIGQLYQQLLCLESSPKKQQQQHSERVRVVYVLSKGGLGMCEPNDFYLRVFMFWFDRKSIIPENFGFAITKY